MPVSQIIFDYAATVRLVRSLIAKSPSKEPVSLADIVECCVVHATIVTPTGVSMWCEQRCVGGVQLLRLVIHNVPDCGRTALTRSFDRGELISGRESAESIALAIQRIVGYANELFSKSQALKVGMERIELEIDYRDPQNLIILMENRGCAILDQSCVARLVAEEPGPLYYGDIDLCEDGGSWALSGGPWASRLEEKLQRLGALER